MWSASSRRNQSTIVGWVDAQEKDRTGTTFTETATALGRRCELAGAMTTTAAVKTEEEEKRRRRRFGTYSTAQKFKEATMEPFLRQCDAKDGHNVPGTPKKVAGHVATVVNTVHSIYKFAIHQNSQITLKFSQKSPKIKVVQNQKFYNFAFITNP